MTKPIKRKCANCDADAEPGEALCSLCDLAAKLRTGGYNFAGATLPQCPHHPTGQMMIEDGHAVCLMCLQGVA